MSIYGQAKPPADLGPLFSQRSDAKSARDDAVTRVDAHAPDDWKALADAKIRQTAAERPDFISTDVWKRGLPTPPQPRALGPRLTAAQKAGIIEPTSLLRTSDRTERHAAPCRVWRSLIYGKRE